MIYLLNQNDSIKPANKLSLIISERVTGKKLSIQLILPMLSIYYRKVSGEQDY